MARNNSKPSTAQEIGSTSDVHNALSFYGNSVLTKKGSLIGAIELHGRDPDGLIAEDFQGLSYIGRAVFQELDTAVIVTQYYAHFDGADVRNMDTIKLHNSVSTYVRVLAVNKFGTKHVPWGLWADHKGAPVRLPGNYLLMTRLQTLSRLQTSMLFGAKERELNRQALDFRSLMKGEQSTELERRELMKPAIREAFDELGEAEMVGDTWGRAHAFITTWAETLQSDR